MRFPWLVTLITTTLPILPVAGNADQLPSPMVIQSNGPQDAMTLVPHAGRMRPVATVGEYGGGFLELLMTGHSPAEVRYNAPPRQMASYAPQRTSDGLARVTDPMYARQEVDYSGPYGVGTIVIDTPNKFLYLALGNGRALRYGIGVGRPGFTWSGVKTITRKAEWPDWTPPQEMLLRRPDLPRHLDGGPANPLGSRALYLGSSLYRIHGTNEPETIGTNVSSGCIRMLNEDVMDLYGRVRVGTKVIVI